MYQQTADDVAALNRQLRELQKQGYDYVGDFHRHPRGLTTLSNGDINTCRDILADPDYAVNGQLIMCIVTEGKEDFPIYAYRVVQSNCNAIAERVDIEVMPLRCIERCLSFNFNQANLKGETTHEKDSYLKHSN
jgi:proteasome lid subunit RPN8/RPN11